MRKIIIQNAVLGALALAGQSVSGAGITHSLPAGTVGSHNERQTAPVERLVLSPPLLIAAPAPVLSAHAAPVRPQPKNARQTANPRPIRLAAQKTYQVLRPNAAFRLVKKARATARRPQAMDFELKVLIFMTIVIAALVVAFWLLRSTINIWVFLGAIVVLFFFFLIWRLLQKK